MEERPKSTAFIIRGYVGRMWLRASRWLRLLTARDGSKEIAVNAQGVVE
jgi:hypothetical protein